MPFCSNCGTEAGTGTFCTNCGKSVPTGSPDQGQFAPPPPSIVVPPQNYFEQEQPKKTFPKKALLAVGGGLAVLVVGVIVLTSTLTTPLKLDAASAEEVLFSAFDFSVELGPSEDSLSISESENPIFGVGEDCEPDARLAGLISSNGTLLATRDLNSISDSGIYVHQDIIEFDSVESAAQFVAITREGLAFPDCEYNNVDESSSFLTEFTVLGDTQGVYGVGSEESVVWSEAQQIIAFELDFDLSSDSQTAVVRQNNYVLVLHGTVYRDTDAFGSIRDLENDFSAIAKQFVSGKRTN